MKLLTILGVLLLIAIVQSKKKQNRVIIIITDEQKAAKRGMEAEPRLDNDVILGTRDVDLQNEELKRDLDETMEDHVKKEADTFGV